MKLYRHLTQSLTWNKKASAASQSRWRKFAWLKHRHHSRHQSEMMQLGMNLIAHPGPITVSKVGERPPSGGWNSEGRAGNPIRLIGKSKKRQRKKRDCCTLPSIHPLQK